MKQLKHIFSQRLAGYLMYRGFYLQSMHDDFRSDRPYHIFIFKDSDEIRNAINDYSEMQKSKK